MVNAQVSSPLLSVFCKTTLALTASPNPLIQSANSLIVFTPAPISAAVYSVPEPTLIVKFVISIIASSDAKSIKDYLDGLAIEETETS